MTIIEVNIAGFQFTRCVPDVPGQGDRHAWHISRMHHLPWVLDWVLGWVHVGRFACRRDPRLRTA